MAWARGARPGRRRRPGPHARRTPRQRPTASSRSARRRSPGRPARYSTAELIAVERSRARARRARLGSGRSGRVHRGARAADNRRSRREQQASAASGRHQPRPRRLRRRARGRRQDDRHPRRRRGVPSGRRARHRAAHRPASPPRSSRTRPASPRQPSTGSSQTELPERLPARRRRGRHGRDPHPRRRCSSASSRRQGKAILIGDPHQLPAVGAGGLFAGIVERHGAIELTENRRQHDPEERRALEAVRNGLGRDYLAFAEGSGRLVASETPLATRTRLLADWWARGPRRPPRQHHDLASPPRRRRAERTRARPDGDARPARSRAPPAHHRRVRTGRSCRLPPQLGRARRPERHARNGRGGRPRSPHADRC